MSKQSVSDLLYGRGGRMIAHERAVTCCHCHERLPEGRFLFCDNICRDQARAIVRTGYLGTKRAGEIDNVWPELPVSAGCPPCDAAQLRRARGDNFSGLTQARESLAAPHVRSQLS
jgi:hypothetical protein